MIFRKSKLIIYFSFCFILLIQNCKKKDDVVPNVYVDFYLYLSDPDFSGLNAIGNSVYVTGGYSGIVIYRKSIEEFIVLDRACTNAPSKECERVEVDNSGLFAVCPCCGSRYTLADGYVVEGPASRPLKEYGSSFDGNNVLHVFN